MRRRMARFTARADLLSPNSKRSAGRKTRRRGGIQQKLKSRARRDGPGMKSTLDRSTNMRTHIKATSNTGQP